MKIARLNDTMLMSSDVGESLSAWSSTTAYSAGDQVLYPSDYTNSYLCNPSFYCSNTYHYSKPTKTYEALTATTGDNPAENPEIWADVGASNRWRMFDDVAGTYTEGDTNTIYLLLKNAALAANYLYISRMFCESLDVAFYNGCDGSVISSNSFSYYTTLSNYPDNFIMATAPLQEKILIPGTNGSGTDSDCVFVKLVVHPYGFRGSSPLWRIGLCKSGYAVDIGKTQWPVKTRLLDYSQKIKDNFGNTFLSPGRYATEISADVKMPIDDLHFNEALIASLRGVPAIFDFNNDNTDYDHLWVYGFCSDFTIKSVSCTVAIASITVEGLV